MADYTVSDYKAAAKRAYDAGDTAAAKRLISKGRELEASQTGVIDQLGSGVNEGLASFLGLPVQAATGVVNALQTPELRLKTDDGLNVIGAEMTSPKPIVEKPVGGTETFLNALSPLISDAQPQGIGQRYARRIGQEVGFGVPASMVGARLPGMGPAIDAFPAYVGASAAGDVGAAIGGQTSREIAPNSDTADLIASMIGGGAGAYAASKMTPRLENTPTLDEIKAREADRWRKVENSNVQLTPQAEQEYLGKLRQRLTDSRATNPNLFPRANATIDDIAGNPNRTLYGIEEDRRLMGRNVAGNADEARVGVAMKKEIDDYLKSLDSTKVQGADPQQAVDDAVAARELTSRRSRAEEIINKEMRGETRAATSGTGGNEVNAIRQNIRTVYDRERDPTLKGKRVGYKPDELAAMEKVVNGSTGSNLARLIGRMAPTSGALPLMATGWGGAAGIGAAMAGANPLAALPAFAGGIGFAGKSAAEGITKRQIDDLLKTILNGGKAPSMSAARNASTRAIIEQLLTNSLSGNQQ